MTSTGYEFEQEFWSRIRLHALRTKQWVIDNGFIIPDDGTIGATVFTIQQNDIPNKPSWQGMMNRAFYDKQKRETTHGISNFNDAFRMIRIYLMKHERFYIVSQNNVNADAKYNGWGLGGEKESLKHLKRISNYSQTVLNTVIEELEAFSTMYNDWQDKNAKAELLDILKKIDDMKRSYQQLTGETYTHSLFLWGLLNAGNEDENEDDKDTDEDTPQ